MRYWRVKQLCIQLKSKVIVLCSTRKYNSCIICFWRVELKSFGLLECIIVICATTQLYLYALLESKIAGN